VFDIGLFFMSNHSCRKKSNTAKPMDLLSRARQLIASGNLATASVIAIAPLATAVSDASITFNTSTQTETAIFGLGTKVDAATFTDFAQSGGSSYTFTLQLGNGTQTDSDIFSSLSKDGRSGSFVLSGSCSGSFDAGEHAVLAYSVTTYLSNGLSSVEYYADTLFISDSAGTCCYFSGGSSRISSSGSTSTVNDTIPIVDFTTYGNSVWAMELRFDWDIENTYPLSYSTSDILKIVVEGTLTTVPEPSSWGLLGASAALGAAAMLRRRKNTLPPAGA
jgi:hypothetical protein